MGETSPIRRSRRTTRPAVAVGLAALLVLAACSSSNSYDPAKVEAELAKTQQGHLRGLPEGKATCPKGLKLTEGMTFQCTLDIAGTQAPYKVTLTDVDNSTVHLKAQPAKAILSVATLDTFVEKNLDEASAGATAACGKAGQKVILADAGQKITCNLTRGSQTGTVQLTVKDTQGNVELG